MDYTLPNISRSINWIKLKFLDIQRKLTIDKVRYLVTCTFYEPKTSLDDVRRMTLKISFTCQRDLLVKVQLYSKCRNLKMNDLHCDRKILVSKSRFAFKGFKIVHLNMHRH